MDAARILNEVWSDVKEILEMMVSWAVCHIFRVASHEGNAQKEGIADRQET